MPFYPRGHTLRDHLVPQRAEIAGGRAQVGRPPAARSRWILGAVLVACALATAPAPARAASVLSNGSVTPNTGPKATVFSFSVDYASSNPTRNAQDVWAEVGSVTVALELVSGNPHDGTWQGTSKLPVGTRQVTFHASTSASPQPAPLDGPTITVTNSQPTPTPSPTPIPTPTPSPTPRPTVSPTATPAGPTPTAGATARPGSTPSPVRARGTADAAVRCGRRLEQRPEPVDLGQWHGRGPLRNSRPEGDASPRRGQRSRRSSSRVRPGRRRRRPDGAANPVARAIPDRRRSDERRRGGRPRPPVVRHPPTVTIVSPPNT